MNGMLLVGVGLGVGFVLAGWLINPSSCCAVVADGARDKARGVLPSWAVAIADRFGLWKYTAGLAGLLGGA
jgi:hypothetical protein